jgi:hypothetical protein
VKATFDGLNFFDQRFANNGNQFSVEPPDQVFVRVMDSFWSRPMMFFASSI